MPELRTVMTGIVFGESPRWHDGRLWFSDWGAHQVVAVDVDADLEVADLEADADGTSEVVVSVPSFPLCIDFLPDGRLLLVSSADRLLLRREPDGVLVTHADLSILSDKPWNDIVVDGRGNAYVNNIGYDFPDGEPGPGTVRAGHSGRDDPAGSGRPDVSQRDGRDARRRDADRRRVPPATG